MRYIRYFQNFLKAVVGHEFLDLLQYSIGIVYIGIPIGILKVVLKVIFSNSRLVSLKHFNVIFLILLPLMVDNSAVRNLSSILPYRMPTPSFAREMEFNLRIDSTSTPVPNTPNPRPPTNVAPKNKRQNVSRRASVITDQSDPTFIINLRNSIQELNKSYANTFKTPAKLKTPPTQKSVAPKNVQKATKKATDVNVLDATIHDGLINPGDLDLGMALIAEQRKEKLSEEDQLKLTMIEQNVNLQKYRLEKTARESGRRLRSHDHKKLSDAVNVADKMMKTAERSLLAICRTEDEILPGISGQTNFSNSAEICEVLSRAIRNYKIKQKQVLCELAEDANGIKNLIAKLQQFLGSEFTDALERCSHAVQLDPNLIGETIMDVTAGGEDVTNLLSDEEDVSFQPSDSWDKDDVPEEDWTIMVVLVCTFNRSVTAHL